MPYLFVAHVLNSWRRSLCPFVLFCTTTAFVACAPDLSTRNVNNASQLTNSNTSSATFKTLMPHEMCQAIAADFSAETLENTELLQAKRRALVLLQESLAGLPGRALKDSQIILEAGACLQETNQRLLAILDASPEKRFQENKRPIAGILAEFHTTIAQMNTHAHAIFSVLSVDEILNDDILFAHFQRFHSTFSLAQIADFLDRAALNERLSERILTLSTHISTLPLTHSNPYPSLKRMAESLANQKDGAKQGLLARVIATDILKNGFSFSLKGKAKILRDFANSISYLKKHLQTLPKNSDLAKSTRQSIANLETERKDILNLDFGLNKAFAQLAQEAEALGVEGAASLIAKAAQDANSTFASTFADRGLKLQEGDAWLLVSQNGAGDLFSTIAQVADFVTHSGIVASDVESGFRYFYRAEVGEGLIELPLAGNQQDMIFVRPTFPVQPGLSATALAALSKNKTILFDLTFRDGMFDDQGRVSLYCAEFIHFFFKKHFDQAGPDFTSPFDTVETHLEAPGPFAVRNAGKLGYDLNGRFYIPDSLLYANNLTNISAMYTETQSSAGIGSEVDAFKESMRGVFNDSLAKYFRERDFAPVTFAEQMTIDALLAARALSIWIPALQKLIPDALGLLDGVSLPKGPQKYVTLKFYQLYGTFEGSLAGLRSTTADGTPLPDWKERYLTTYNTTVKTKLEGLFLTHVGP